MDSRIKKLTALLAAAACVTAAPLSACKNEDEPYVEDGVTVTVDYNDGSASRPRTYYLEDGASINAPDTPQREGYSLSGWYTDKENGEKVEFPYTPAANTTLYARWEEAVYDVTFDFVYNGSTPVIKQIAYNHTVEALAESEIPEYEGHNFYRWENAPENGIAIEFPYTVRREITFYAHWIGEDITTHTVDFNINFGDNQIYRSITKLDGEEITVLDVPEPDANVNVGHTFMGWATTPDATEPDVTLPYSPTGESHITLYAVWREQDYQVRFRYNYTGAPGGVAQAYEEYRKFVGDVIEKPAQDPVREGFTFGGWYTVAAPDLRIEEEVQFPYTLERGADISFYARWIAERVTPTNNIFDAEFTAISRNFRAATYSGNVQGTQIILADGSGTFNAHSEEYPLLDRNHREHTSYYILGLYQNGASLTFEIYSSAHVTNATLYASLAVEQNANVTIAPTGEHGFRFLLNDNEINYGSINLTRPNANTGTTHQSAFDEYRVATGLKLVEGLNTVVLMVNNSTVSGAAQAFAPLIDYIRLDVGNAAELSWHPEYDNLYRRT